MIWVRRCVPRTLVGLFLLLATSGASMAATKAEFDGFANRFIDGWYAFRPVQATRDGLHAHDGRLAGFRRDEIEAEIARLRTAAEELLALKPAGLDSGRVVDREILLGRIDAARLDLETLRTWETDPGLYLEMITDGVNLLASGNFAPPAERLKNIIAREKESSAVLAAAFENIVNPPKIWVEAAIERTRGAVAWFRDTLPASLDDPGDPALRAEFEATNAGLVRDLESSRAWLEQSVLPVARGSWALGAENLQRWLQQAELTDIPLYRLARAGQEEVKRLQTELKAAAAAVNPVKSPAELLRILSIDHPEERYLVRETTAGLESVRREFARSALVTPAVPDTCLVRLIPEFERAECGARLVPPGVFETKDRRARLELTPPDGRSTLTEQDDQLRPFNRYALPLFLMSETWPGRLLRAQSDARQASRVRRAFPSATSTLGWELYTGQVLIEQGWGAADPRFRFFQTRQGLTRACLFVTAIRLHGGEVTIDQAVDYLVKEGTLEPVLARREVLRLTRDVTGMADVLGKLQIEKARDDYERYRGGAWSLREFHDRMLATGSVAMKAMRTLIMPGDKGTLL